VKHHFRLSLPVLIFAVITSASLLLAPCLESAGIYLQKYIGLLGFAAIQFAFLLSCLVSCVFGLWAFATHRHSVTVYAAVAIQIVAVLLFAFSDLPSNTRLSNIHEESVNLNQESHHGQWPLSCIRCFCNIFRICGNVTPEVFFDPCLLDPQKRKRHAY
jgi:hypothetical protein